MIITHVLLKRTGSLADVINYNQSRNRGVLSQMYV